ncbi:extensin-like [Lathyrus oleraceus]|uniref:extensin-like n=1 Tax=Pisum sativum TaxID=3888 RepID=UPI0021CE9041|nr:extensin-like [Pisum sativum]
MYYLDDLRKQGVEFSDFSLDWLPEFPPDFMKRPREPSEKAKQAKRAKLGESFGSRPPVPLVGSSGKSVFLPPSIQVKPIASSIPQPSPIYTNSETPPSTTKPSNQPSQKFNLATTSQPISEVEMLNETTSPSPSSSPESPPYYTHSSDTEPSDPQSPTLAQLQHHALAS